MVLLEKIALGKQGMKVTKLGYGCMGLTTAYGKKLDDKEIVEMLEKVYSEGGVNLWDTANIYVFPQFSRLLTLSSPIVCQEEIIRHAIEKVGRENLVISTKTGIEINIFPKLSIVPNGSPAFIRKQCEASLKRLNVDCIDLFYLHRIDQKIPIEVSMMEMKKLVQEGKIKYVGLSECSANTIRRAHAVHPLTAVQMEYSLWCRGIEKEVIPTCAELGIGVVAYSPLGRGFFGGAHKQEMDKSDYRSSEERFKSEKNTKMLERVEEIAKAKGVTPAQLALAWVEAQQDRLAGAGVVAIPGTTKMKNLMSNVESCKIELSKEELTALEEAVPAEEVEGARYATDSNIFEADKNPELTEEQKKELGLA